MFEGPLADDCEEKKAGWIGTWIGPLGRDIYKTLEFASVYDKKKPKVVLDKFEAYVRPRKNKRIARNRLKKKETHAK